MRYIAAYMLAILGGNEKPSADDIRMIIESVGVEVEENKLSILMDKLKGKNLTQIQEEGLARLQTVPGLNALSEAKEETPPPVVVQIKDKDDDQIDDGDSDDDSLGMLDIFG